MILGVHISIYVYHPIQSRSEIVLVVSNYHNFPQMHEFKKSRSQSAVVKGRKRARAFSLLFDRNRIFVVLADNKIWLNLTGQNLAINNIHPFWPRY